jgi:hypothetical protein
MREEIERFAFIGDANWDLYLSPNNPKYLRSIPKPNANKSVCGSTFGDKHHILKLIRMGFFESVPTEVGLEFLNGLHSSIFAHEDGSKFHYLRFAPNTH